MEALKDNQPANENLLEKTLDSLEFYLLIVFLALLPLSYTPFAYDFFNISKITLIRLTGLLLLASLSVKLIFNKKIKIPKSPLFYAILGYFLTLTISSALSIHLSTSLLGLRKRYFGLLTYAPIFIIIYTIWIKKLSPNRQRYLFITLAGSATVVSLIALLQTMGAAFPLDLKSKFGSSAYSTIGNPNLLGIYLNLVLPLCLALTLTSKKYLQRYVFIVCGVIIFGAILATNSSGAILAAIVSVLLSGFFILNEKRSIKRKTVLIFVALLVIVLVVFVNQTAKSENASWQSRTSVWKSSVTLMIENPLHGAGLDTMRFALPKVKKDYSGYDKETFEDAHNIFLTTGATAGLPALALFISVLILTAGKVKHFASQSGHTYKAFALSISIIAYLLTVQVNPDHIVSLTIFWIFIALIGYREETYSVISLPKFPALLSGVTILLVSAQLFYFNHFPFLAEIQLQKAQQVTTINQAYSYYSKAQNYNPYYDINWYSFAERILPRIKADDQTANFAISSAIEATRISPLERDNYALLGDIYKKLGENTGNRDYLQKAASNYLKALSLDRFDLDVMYNLAFTYEKLGEPRKALKTANLYLSLEEDPQIRTLKTNLENEQSDD